MIRKLVVPHLVRASEALVGIANAGGFIPVPNPYEAHRKLPTIRPLVDFDTRATSLADRLPWNLKLGTALGNTVLNRDFSFTRVMRVKAKKDLSWAPRHVRREVNERLTRGIANMTDGWAMHAYLKRTQIRSYPSADFPDMSSWLVDEERKAAFNSGQFYKSDILYAFTYLPPADSLAKLERGLFRYEGKNKEVVAGFSETLATLEQGIASLKHVLKNDLSFEDLSCREATNSLGGSYVCDDQLSEYLALLTGREQPVQAPRPGMILSEYLADHLTLLTDGVMRVGNMLVRPITVSDYPDSTAPDVFDMLEAMPGHFTLGVRYLGRDREKAEKEMRSLRTVSMQKRTGMKDALTDNPEAMIDPAALAGANDATEAFGVSRRKISNYGYVTTTVVAYEPIANSINDAMRRITNLSESLAGRLAGDGFLVSTEDGNEFEALLGFLPGNGHDNVVRGMLNSHNVGNMVPTVTPWLGEWTAPDTANYGENQPPLAVFPAYGTTPCALNLLTKRRGGHTIVVAGTGKGKTTLVAFLLNQARKYSPQILVVDNEYQHWVHLKTIPGARHVILSPDSPDGLSPLAGSDKRGLPMRHKFVSMLLGAQNVDWRSYNEAIYEALYFLMIGAPDQQTISGLMMTPGISPPLRNALKIYARGGPFGRIFDNPPTTSSASFTVYETSGLPKDKDNYAIALSALDMETTRKTRERRPTLIASEEAWEQIQDPIGADIFQRGLRLKRRQGGTYILITQAIEDIDSSPYAKAIMGQFVTKLLFPDETATTENAERLGRFGLEAWEREALVSHVGQNAVYVIKPEGRRMIDTTLGPIARATCGLTDTESIERATMIMNQFGQNFYPELIYNEFEPHKSENLAAIAEGWRRHAYFFPHRNDDVDLPAQAPAHEQPHEDDPFGLYIDQNAPLTLAPVQAAESLKPFVRNPFDEITEEESVIA